MDIFATIAERKISEAVARGEFDDLPLKGQKLDLNDDAFIPVEFRMAYRILKNAGIVPDEVRLNSEITSLKSLLDRCLEGQRDDINGRIRYKLLQLNLLMEKRGRSLLTEEYLSGLRALTEKDRC